MSKLLIKGGLVVTVDDEDRIFRDGSVYVEDNVIEEVGPTSAVGDKDGAEVIDASGKVVIPGFVSCHNHLYSSVVRSIPASGFENVDYSFISWMERFWYPMLEDRVTREQMYIGTLANMVEHMRSGITTTTDTAEGSYALPGALDAVDRAAMESGMRAVLSFETTGRISEENAQMGLEENVKFFKKAKARGGRVTGRLGVHTTFSCSTELLKQVRATADELGAGVMMHMADDRYHVYDTTRRFGLRPTAYLEKIGFLAPDLILFHCSYLDPWKDPAIFKAHDVKIAHNAESNAIFGFWPDMKPFLAEGVTVGLGTDGQTHSMFEIMRTAQMIHRIKYEDLEMLPDQQMLRMATIEGAKALQMEDEIGSLEGGKKADVVLIDDRSTVPVFEVNVFNYLVGTCERVDVNTVIVDGEVLMRDGEFLRIDEEEMRSQTKEEAIKLWEANEWPTP
jgi:5-methylthioadenosine/S-adenosylhomocysteine deaminase